VSILNCPSKRVDYIPIPPLPAGGYTEIKIENNVAKPVVEGWPTGSGSAEKVNALLTNIATDIASSEVGGSGEVASIFSASHSHKQYVIDFMKFRIEPLTTAADVTTPLGWVRVGAGMRVVVDITKSDGSVSGSLIALAANAKANKLEGFMSVELIGIDAKETTASMPFTVDLSEGNVQKVIEALAVVKTKLYDPTTTVRPNFIARVECSPLATAGKK